MFVLFCLYFMFFCVQSVIDAVRQINTDPARTPTALAVSFHSQDFKHCDFQELATNPDNLLLFTSLVVTTVFVAQVRKLFLFLKNIFEMVGNTNNFIPVRTRLIVSNCSSPHLFSSAPLSQLLSRFFLLIIVSIMMTTACLRKTQSQDQ